MNGRTLSQAPRGGFTLIELLVVISIIALLISILMPSLSRAREQAKSVHCLARLKDFGNALATYNNLSGGGLPPARWLPEPAKLNDADGSDRGRGVDRRDVSARAVEYGWAEILFQYLYREEVKIPQSYPVLRNLDARRFEDYFLCRAVGDTGITSGHYRVYLPAWSAGSYGLEAGGQWGELTRADPNYSATRDNIRPRLPLMGDANDRSERGDGRGLDDCSYIDAGEANYAGSDGRRNGNRFSDRHSGGTNYLFQDLHGEWNTRLRSELARDYDLNGVIDIATQP